MSRAQIRQQWRAHFRGESVARPIARAGARGGREPGGSTDAEPHAKTALSGLWIEINHLELHGVGRLDEGQVTAALEAELKTLIAAKGAPRGWVGDQVLERVDAARADHPTRVSAKWLGSQVGRTIYNLRSAERR